MSSRTWLRRWRIVVSAGEPGETGTALDVSDLRCVFKVRCLPDKPATASVQIYNFNRATEKLALKGYRLIIMAGYREGGSFGQIFDGSILQSFTNRQGQDWVWEAVAVSGGYVSDMVIGSLGAGGSQREELGFIADRNRGRHGRDDRTARVIGTPGPWQGSFRFRLRLPAGAGIRVRFVFQNRREG